VALPAFNAHAALYRSTATYRQRALPRTAAGLRTADDPCTVECTQPWDVPEYHPDPYSCNHYYQCVQGLPFRQPCPPLTVYNPTAQPGPVCDHPWNYSCQPSCS
jgi:hypothetical protein